MIIKLVRIAAWSNIVSGIFFLWLPAAGFHKVMMVSPLVDATVNAVTLIVGYATLRVFAPESQSKKGAIAISAEAE